MTDAPARDRVVLDCSVVFQAAARPAGPAAACLDLVLSGRIEALISPAILAEVADVLNRPEVRGKFPALTAETVRTFLEILSACATLIEDVPSLFSYPRDPNDEPYLNLALFCGANYLVTRDKDLLDLRDDDSPEWTTARSVAPGLSILDPVEYLQIRRQRK